MCALNRNVCRNYTRPRKVWVIWHNPHTFEPSFYQLLETIKVSPQGIQQRSLAKLFLACNWWKTVNIGTIYIEPSEAVVYGILLVVTRLRLVTPWVYPIHHSFLEVYLSLDPSEAVAYVIPLGLLGFAL